MSGDSLVLTLVLFAALLHAAWNALVKSSGDSWLTSLMLFAAGSGACALALPFVAVPARESWPYLALGIFLHNGYIAFLLLSYRAGDLSHVYPLARGFAPLLVAAFSGRIVGEHLSPLEVAGTALVSLGIASLALERGAAGAAGAGRGRAAGYALATGVWIAAYTLVDGMGVRKSGATLGYIVWLQALESIPFVAVTLALRRGEVRAFAGSRAGRRGIVGGLMATLAYSLVLWAYSLGAIAPIAALRETSTIFAALLGTFVLGEPFGRRRILAAVVVASGVAALNI